MIHHNFIAIEGNIGAGKTSLAMRIAKDFNAKLILEEFEDNTFLPKFYKEPEKFAFPLEMSFLASRYQQLKDKLSQQDLFKDFTITDYYIIKSLIFARKTLQPDEFTLYQKFFDIIFHQLPKPDLLVYLYLKTPNLQKNIHKRGRVYELEIEDSYLDKIQEGYFEFFKQHNNSQPIVIVDTNNIDFVNNKDDYDKMITILSSKYSPGIHRIIP
jgi:deoxyadenosine/deoxycytidine kinase